VQRALILFGFVPLYGACGHPAPAPLAPAPAPTVAPAPPPVEPTGCHAEPATVYGDEAVVFDIAAPSETQVDVELLDSSGHDVAKASLAAPGKFRPPSVPSGDFTLRVGSGNVRCIVTVNRELPRASQAKR